MTNERKPNKIEFWRESPSEWRWCFRFCNGKIGAMSGQGHCSRKQAVESAQEVIGCLIEDDEPWPDGLPKTFEVPAWVREPANQASKLAIR